MMLNVTSDNWRRNIIITILIYSEKLLVIITVVITIVQIMIIFKFQYKITSVNII